MEAKNRSPIPAIATTLLVTMLAVLALLLAVTPALASPNGVVISELRFRGPGAADDEYVELRNTSNAPVDISGYRLQACAARSGNPTNRAEVPTGTVLQAGQYFLLTGPGYSEATPGDQIFRASISDRGGARIVTPGGIPIDGVGSSDGAVDMCREDPGLGLPASSRPDGGYSFERLDNGTQDTNNNAADFAGPKQSNPQNTNSPFNRDPVASNDTATTMEDSAVNINVLVNDTDPDGNALTVTGVSNPTNGTAKINANNTVTYTPAPDYNGTDSFSYTISDNNGGTGTASVTVVVTPVPEPPVVRPPVTKPLVRGPKLKPPKRSSGCTVNGTRGSDVLFGTPRRDVICAGGGNDILLGFGGNDVLKGGGGNDLLIGGRGKDVLIGGRGNDNLVGVPGRDRKIGGPGKDSSTKLSKNLTRKLINHPRLFKKYL